MRALLPIPIHCPNPLRVSLKADSKFVGVAQSTNYDSWLIDSGASEHFSGHKSDFTSIKRWREGQQEVEIAHGTILPVEGYGDIVFITSHGKLPSRAKGISQKGVCEVDRPEMLLQQCVLTQTDLNHNVIKGLSRYNVDTNLNASDVTKASMR